jgi:hypothetical protein
VNFSSLASLLLARLYLVGKLIEGEIEVVVRRGFMLLPFSATAEAKPTRVKKRTEIIAL